MMNRRVLLGGLLTMAILGGAGRTEAVNANFQGNCTNSPGSATSCVFSMNKAPSGEPYTGCGGAGGIWYLYWDFGDGNFAVTYPTINYGRANHTYSAGPISLNVFMVVICNDGQQASANHCLNTTPTTGCIIPNGGWSPY